MKKFILFVILLTVSTTLFAITDKQKSDLLFMYQEEKLAHDTYQYFAKLYPIKVFTNITKSEANHMDEVESLLIAYKIQVPNLKDGQFIDKSLQALYDKFIKDGKTSQKEALDIAMIIEEKDISDLKEKIKNSPSDIALVYSNLLKGSENHKKAFGKW